MTDTLVKTALISVADKTGLVAQARRLDALGIRIVSTGGSAHLLQNAGIAVTAVDSLTRTPSMMGGRVKTLHPAVHAGVLMRRDDSDDLDDALTHRIEPIDLVYVTLYPFADTVSKGANPDTCIEQIDIGGPAILRAAAKNARWVTVCAHPDQMDQVLAEMENSGGRTTLALRGRLAALTFAHTADYEAAIASWYAGRGDIDQPPLVVTGTRGRRLRYGENPHQAAHLWLSSDNTGIAGASVVQGKALSYNNIADLDAACALAREFPCAESGACAAIVKHCTPCGAALADTLAEALARARASDPVSAFGGVIALNTVLDVDTAEVLVSEFTEAVIAPEVRNDALSVLGTRKDLRVVLTGPQDEPLSGRQIRSVSGGFLVQEQDDRRLSQSDLRVVSQRRFESSDIDDAVFAWRIVKHARSNAIVFARDRAVIGIGSGQTSRVDAVSQAVGKAGKKAEKGFVVASDGFFPFPDGVVEAAKAGARAIVQPGGSIRDDQVTAAADSAGIAMALTGVRHFRH